MCTFLDLPPEIVKHVGTFLFTQNSNILEVIESGKNIKILSSVNKTIFIINNLTNMNKLKNMFNNFAEDELKKLEKKYSQYNALCHDPYKHYTDINMIPVIMKITKGAGPLFDAVMTGCVLPVVKYSQYKYDQEVENDIKMLLRVAPESVEGRIGQMRSVHGVSALVGAIFNEKIPVSTIKFLLDNKANPNVFFATACKKTQPFYVL